MLKNSEFHAAMGLVNLGHIQEIHENRKRITERYDQKLIGFKGLNQSCHKQGSLNYAYYPLVVESEEYCISAWTSKKQMKYLTSLFLSFFVKGVALLRFSRDTDNGDIT
jgi:dTDP-4-amino-4,6-dideoxygalactose transaminase